MTKSNTTFKTLISGVSALAIAFGAAYAQDTEADDDNSAEELNQQEVQDTDDAVETSTTLETQTQTDATMSTTDATATTTATAQTRTAAGDGDWETKTAKWDAAAEAALSECQSISEACSIATENAAGVLVFPELTSASFVVGGTGGKGVLMVDGAPAGYYNLAAGSIGFQIGVQQVSQVMTFNSAEALADLQGDAEWRAGADANVTVVNTGANAQYITDGDLDRLGEVTAIVFDQNGLSAGAALTGIRLAEVTYDGDMDTDEDWSDEEVMEDDMMSDDMMEDDMDVEPAEDMLDEDIDMEAPEDEEDVVGDTAY